MKNQFCFFEKRTFVNKGCNLQSPYLLTVLLSIFFNKLPCFLSLQNAWRQITFFNNEAKTSYHSIQCQSNIRNIKKKYLGISIRLQYVWPLCVFNLISNWEIKLNIWKTSSKKNHPNTICNEKKEKKSCFQNFHKTVKTKWPNWLLYTIRGQILWQTWLLSTIIHNGGRTQKNLNRKDFSTKSKQNYDLGHVR